MRVVVLHNEPGENAAVDDLDVIVQRNVVVNALQENGHEVSCLECSLDLEATRNQLLRHVPDVVFNLVESLGGTDRLMGMAPMLLDAMEIPYTGAQTDAMMNSSNKLTAKKRLSAAGLPTPPWHSTRKPERNGFRLHGSGSQAAVEGSNRWILKPVLEHASFGIDDDAVVAVTGTTSLDRHLRSRERKVARPHFAELFIEGREFNLSLLNGKVLPPAEIDFVDFPPGKPHIVGHLAKWDPDSFEYLQTPRRFLFPASDRQLLKQLSQLARDCWQLFDLSGHARVDFRVDQQGRPWILEINANPCLSPDAGFSAALVEAKIPFSFAIQRIIDDALRCGRQISPSCTPGVPSRNSSRRILDVSNTTNP